VILHGDIKGDTGLLGHTVELSTSLFSILLGILTSKSSLLGVSSAIVYYTILKIDKENK